MSVADKVDLMYEGFGEIEKGNPESVFLDIYRESLKTILQFRELASVQYFLDHILPDMLHENFADKSHLKAITAETIAQVEAD